MIIANWKMNGSKKLIEVWVDFVSENIEVNQEKECIFCPPSCFLDYSKKVIAQKGADLKLGSQQLDSELSAPLTGAISSEMLVDIGCEFVIIGHSEQRNHVNESNQILADKLKVAIDNNLRPIFCIGESLKQKNANQTKAVLLEQLDAVPHNIVDKCIVAYEPVWAIGTGENAEVSYIEDIHTFIKRELQKITNSANHISVVYGGSVNLNNYKDIYSSDWVDGLLIGGASLDSKTFTTIYNMS
tara:strand:- start:131 stop:859 length:729 start_codon:yes stop_codon:yes gene_type:complete